MDEQNRYGQDYDPAGDADDLLGLEDLVDDSMILAGRLAYYNLWWDYISEYSDGNVDYEDVMRYE